MTLPALQLDDLNWRDMVQAIRGRIAAVSDEEWTLHAPVDPGVTLLELFAYLLEQRVYWLDQVPDALINALIALLGAQPRPARAATTLLELLTDAAPAELLAGAVFEPLRHEVATRLTTREDVAILRIERIEVATLFGATAAAAETTPRWAMQPLTVLPADRSGAEVAITLWLRQAPLASQAGKTLALFLDLDGPARIPAAWSSQAVNAVPPPAQLEYHYSAAGPTGRAAFAANAVTDGTQSLRRPGVLSVAIPAAWLPVGAPLHGLTPYRLWLRTEDASFSAPPRLNRLIPNVSSAVHAVRVQVSATELNDQIKQWLPLPGRYLQLSDRSPPLEDSIELKLRARDGNWLEWTHAWDFARHGPTDPVFTVCREFNRIEFGDGLTGRLPVASKLPGPKAELTYLAGGGEAGNVGNGLDWITTLPVPVQAVNAVAVRGGTETETSAQARDRVGASLQDRFVAVTAADYEALAIGTPGVAVARAKAMPGFHPGFPCVSVPGAITIFIVPEVPRHDDWLDSDQAVKAPQPDPGMLTQVRARLDQRRLLTTEVFVRGPAYRPLEVSAILAGAPLDKAEVGSRLREGLSLYLDPLVGGDEGLGWPFGQPARPSEIAHQLQRLAGEDALVERVALRFADTAKPDTPFEDCVDLAIAGHELVVLQSLALQWQPRRDNAGGLR